MKPKKTPSLFMKKTEAAACCALYIAGAALFGWLFFGSPLWGPLFLPGLLPFLRYADRQKAAQHDRLLQKQFKDLLQLLSLSLKAGHSVESAFAESLSEMEKLHGPDAPMTAELARICRNLRLRVPVETLLEDFALRSNLEDIRSFAAVFSAAKRMGGDLPAIIRSTAETIRGRMEVEEEIETVLAAKKFEQKIMAVMPPAIILYMRAGSPGFLDVLYESMIGHLLMGAALAVYGAAVLWSIRIVHIEL